jgi:hypothetical protein
LSLRQFDEYDRAAGPAADDRGHRLRAANWDRSLERSTSRREL